jgi:uncharacterized protein YuzE
MKFQYDREADALIIVLREAPITESDEVGPGLIADFGSNGEIVRLEILDASRKVDDLDHVDVASGR